MSNGCSLHILFVHRPSLEKYVFPLRLVIGEKKKRDYQKIPRTSIALIV